MQSALQSHSRLIEPLQLRQARLVAALQGSPLHSLAYACSPKIPSTVVQASSKVQGLRGLRKFRFLVKPNRKVAGRPFARRRPSNNRTSSRQSWASVEAEREYQAMRVGVAPGHGKSAQVRVCVLGYEGEIQSAVRARSVRSTRWPNPSIEGTSNIWLRQLSAAPHVKR